MASDSSPGEVGDRSGFSSWVEAMMAENFDVLSVECCLERFI